MYLVPSLAPLNMKPFIGDSNRASILTLPKPFGEGYTKTIDVDNCYEEMEVFYEGPFLCRLGKTLAGVQRGINMYTERHYLGEEEKESPELARRLSKLI